MTDLSAIAFYPIAALVLLAGAAMVFFKNLIYSALAMIACFLGVAGVFVLLHAELLAAAQVLIYVGAISVLILFAIMLTRERTGKVELFFHGQAWGALPLAAIAGGIFIAVLARANYNDTSESQNPATAALADLLFNQYAFPFELVSLVLLVAIIGAVILAKREKR